MPHCVLCGNPFKAHKTAQPGSSWRGPEAANLRLPSSGYVVRDMLMTLFPVDPDLCNRLRDPGKGSNMAVCRACFKLTEQIDQLEHKLIKSKENLMFRREKYISTHRSDHALFPPAPDIDDFDDDVIGQPLTHKKTLKLEKFEATMEIGDQIPKQELPDVDDVMGGGGGQDPGREKRVAAVLDAIVKLEQEEYEEFDVPDFGYSDEEYDDDDEDEYKSKKRGRKKLDKKPKRSRNFIKASDDPLTEGQKTRLKPEALIVSGKTTQTEIDELIQQCPDPALVRDILKDLDQDLDDFKQYLPSICTEQEASVNWDIILMRTEEPPAMKHIVPGGLTCFTCSLDFDRYYDKIDHILGTHSDFEPYECALCEGQTMYSSEKAIGDHISAQHEAKELENDEALRTSRDPDERVFGKFYCRVCPAVSTSKLGYWYHWWKRHFKYRQQPCPICGGAALGSAADFRRHVLFVHLEYRFSCPQCETFETQTKECIYRHMSKHDDYKDANADPSTFAPRKRAIKSERKSKDDKKPMQLGMNVCAPMALRKARANSKVPLNLLEKIFVNPDHGLIPTTESQLTLASFPPMLKTHFESQVELLKTRMPDIIDNGQVCRDWATVMYKIGTFKLTYGIPGEFKCFDCGQEFNEVSEKHAHMLDKHENGPYTCEECEVPEVFSVEQQARAHMKSSHRRLQKESPIDAYDHDPVSLVNMTTGGNVFKCKFCSLTCSTEFAYWFHVSSSHRMFKSSRCPDCHQILSGPKNYRHHAMVTHAMYRFKCPECEDKLFNSALLFQRHIKTHMVKVKDSTDNEDANNKLSIHMQKRVKRTEIKCEICGMVIRNENAFARHMLSLHEIKVPVQCKVCKMTLEDPRALEAHKKSEHGVGSCHYCGKSFFVKGDLIAHIEKIHEGKSNEKSFMCEICSKSFITIFQLKTHKVIHNEKALKCQLCPKAYHWKSSLESHMIACHMNNGPKKLHTCEFCGKSFADKSNYKSHRFTHTQEKPYNCAGCGKGFIRKDVLRTHLKSCTVK